MNASERAEDVAQRLALLKAHPRGRTFWQSLPDVLDEDFRRYRRLERRPHRALMHLLPPAVSLLVPGLASAGVGQGLGWLQWALVWPLAALAVLALFSDMSRRLSRYTQAAAVGVSWFWLVAARHATGPEAASELALLILPLSWIAVGLLAGYAWQRVLPAIWACAVFAIVQEGFLLGPGGSGAAAAGLLLGAALATYAVLHDEVLHRQLWLERETTRALERVDPLTGLANRREGQFQTARILAQARRSRRSVALALVDIDGFAALNQRHGQLTGDAVLKALAESLKRITRRPLDVLARHDADQFWVVQDEASAASALNLGAAILAAARDLTGPAPQGAPPVAVRVSVATAFLETVDSANPERQLPPLLALLAEAKAAGGQQARYTALGPSAPDAAA